MQDIILYLGVTAIGYVIGSRLRQKKEMFWWTGRVQTLAIIVLVFAMGSRMGSNSEVTDNLTSIGLYSLLFTVIVMTVCVLSMTLVRRLIGVNRYGGVGEVNPDDINEDSKDEGKGGFDRMTFVIIVSVIMGMLWGYGFVGKLFEDYNAFDRAAGMVIKIGLCVMLIFVGFDLGMEGTVFKNIRRMGLRVFIFPITTIAGTLIGAAICAFILPITVRESLAIGSGLGWYSLAPGIILERGFVTASAIAFLHNVMRELFGIILIPVVAKRIGYVETTCLPGAAAMDICLPIVEKFTNGNVAVYSFISGVTASLSVPVLVSIILG